MRPIPGWDPLRGGLPRQVAPAWVRQLILETPNSPALRTEAIGGNPGTWGAFFEAATRRNATAAGLLRGGEVIANPPCDFALQPGDRALNVVRPSAHASSDYEGAGFRGLTEVAAEGDVVIISDLPGFIAIMLIELASGRSVTRVTVLSPLDVPADLPEGLTVRWVQAPTTSGSGLTEAGGSGARVVFINHDADSHTLMSVLRLEKLTGGTIYTVASYDEPGFDQILLSAGCDFAINEEELAAPVLVQTSTNEGYGLLLEELVSQDPSTHSVVSQKLPAGWTSRSWQEARTHLKTAHEVLALGLIRASDGELHTHPELEDRVSAGDQLLFLAAGGAVDDAVFEG